MSVLTVAQRRAEANGAVKVSKFKGGVRSDDLNTLEIGDQFTIPSSLDIYEQKVGTSGNTTQFIIVDCNGVAKNFYPSSVTKNFAIANEDATLTGVRAKTSGTFCDWFKKHGTVDEAMRGAAGHTIKVSDVKQLRRRVFGNPTETVLTGVMTLDFVGEAPADPA